MKKTDFGIFLENFDKRGSIFRGDYKKKEIFLITEIKKGQSRGGHYHTSCFEGKNYVQRNSFNKKW